MSRKTEEDSERGDELVKDDCAMIAVLKHEHEYFVRTVTVAVAVVVLYRCGGRSFVLSNDKVNFILKEQSELHLTSPSIHVTTQ